MSFARITQNALGRERMLLWLAGAFLLVNAVILSLAARSLEPLAVFAAWGLSVYVGHRLLERDMPQRDPFLFPIAMLLTGWGLLMIERLAPNFTWRQVMWLYVSLAVMLAVSRLPIHLRWLRRYRYTWLSGGLLLLLVTILLGVNPSGSGPKFF